MDYSLHVHSKGPKLYYLASPLLKLFAQYNICYCLPGVEHVYSGANYV